MDDVTLVKIKEMLKELGWSDTVITDYCEQCAHSEEDVPAE